MRLIDADALIEFCAERWIPLNIDAVNMQPTIQPVATDTNVGSNSEIPNSSDCISRQAAIDTAKDWYEGLICGSINGLIKRLNALPTAQPEPKWIPASERLPETEEFVFASLTGKYRNTTFEHACEIADYADGEWCVHAYPHMSAEKCAELIEAWMPLPEPYKPNKKQSGKEGA